MWRSYGGKRVPWVLGFDEAGAKLLPEQTLQATLSAACEGLHTASCIGPFVFVPSASKPKVISNTPRNDCSSLFASIADYHGESTEGN